jgi:hypothetical protein
MKSIASNPIHYSQKDVHEIYEHYNKSFDVKTKDSINQDQ